MGRPPIDRMVKSPTSRKEREKWGTQIFALLFACRNLSYGVTVIVSWLLTTLPIVAVIITLPPVVRPVTS